MMEQWAQYGLLGLVIIALAGWIVKMDKEIRKKEEEFKKNLDEIVAKHESTVEKISVKHEEVVEEIGEKHEEALDNIADKLDKRQAETNQVIREHTNLLSSLKTLLEQQKWKQ